MLASMQDYVQSYADVISRVTGIDVEIMDNRMVRIAGTGSYASGVGQRLDQAGEVYKEVLRKHETILIESPRHHAICANCPDRENCNERLSLATPIVLDGELFGVIGMVCFNEADRQRMLESLDNYTAFISFLAGALSHKIAEQSELNHTTRFLDLMLQAIDFPGQGIMLFDQDGSLLYSNTPAREFFSLPPAGVARNKAPGPRLNMDCIQRSGHAISDFEEFEVTPPGLPAQSVLGRMVHLEASPADQVTLFAFELPERLASMVSGLSSSGTGAGMENILGTSAAMRRLKSQILKVADSNSTVLIVGESGTGKELVARAIHQASPRRDKPFIAINCGGIPDTLLESELFGYVSGAFTGASNKGRMGKFELAEGGVIFLDEISSMPLHMQVKLMRVLQERVIIRLGSNRLIHVDVRVIAASNEDLKECIRRNTFREDLYYRLNVIPLEMPPLRERKGDVAILGEFFLEKYCSLFQKRKPRLRSSLLKILEAYPWPGNVRELEHTLEYAVNMMPDNGPLSLECLPAQVLDSMRSDEPLPPQKSVGQPLAQQEILPLAVLEEQALRAALEHFGSSTQGKKLAAKALGLSLATLYRKLAAFSI